MCSVEDVVMPAVGWLAETVPGWNSPVGDWYACVCGCFCMCVIVSVLQLDNMPCKCLLAFVDVEKPFGNDHSECIPCILKRSLELCTILSADTICIAILYISRFCKYCDTILQLFCVV